MVLHIKQSNNHTWMSYTYPSPPLLRYIRASDRSQKKKSNFAGFLGTISREFSGENFTKKQSVKKQWILWLFLGKFCKKSITFQSLFNHFRHYFALSTTICSRNETMAKPLTSWLKPSFSQHNLCLVVLGRCLHVSVTTFQDKFASLRQVNSPNSWDKFKNCCTDMYLIRFLPNFTVFYVFLWILWHFMD